MNTDCNECGRIAGTIINGYCGKCLYERHPEMFRTPEKIEIPKKERGAASMKAEDVIKEVTFQAYELNVAGFAAAEVYLASDLFDTLVSGHRDLFGFAYLSTYNLLGLQVHEVKGAPPGHIRVAAKGKRPGPNAAKGQASGRIKKEEPPAELFGKTEAELIQYIKERVAYLEDMAEAPRASELYMLATWLSIPDSEIDEGEPDE